MPTIKTGDITRILNCTPSREPEEDWRLENALAADPAMSPAQATLPPRVDLRADWWKAGDQLNTGSCVGWATVDGVLRWHFVKAGRLAQDEPLSPRFQWMAAKETDEFTSRPSTFLEQDGTSLKAALDIAHRYGAARDRDLPFDSGRLYPGDGKTFYAIAARHKIASYFNLNHSLARWKYWIANEGPILTRLNVDATWANVDGSGKLDVYQPDTAMGGHAVALVGYDGDAFIVRNSWGLGWGHGGFAYASKAYMVAFTEAYGVRLP